MKFTPKDMAMTTVQICLMETVINLGVSKKTRGKIKKVYNKTTKLKLRLILKAVMP